MDRILDGTDARAIGERLRLTRDVLGFTQAEFADRCALARNTYNQYEHGRNIPQLQQAIRLCESFDLTLDWIYRGDPGDLPYKLVDNLRAARVR